MEVPALEALVLEVEDLARLEELEAVAVMAVATEVDSVEDPAPVVGRQDIKAREAITAEAVDQVVVTAEA